MNYLSEAVYPQSGQRHVFWQDNKRRFSVTAQEAVVYLCAQCTSVDSKQLFSTAGHIVNEKKNAIIFVLAALLEFK